MADWTLKARQAKEAAKRFGRATARGDCETAQKQKTAYLKAVSQLDQLIGRRSPTVRRLENGLTKMDARLRRCYLTKEAAGSGVPDWYSSRKKR